MGVLNKSVKQTAKGMGFLSNSLKGLFVGFGIREIVRLNDQFNLLRDRIAVFTGDAESAGVVFQKLAKNARETRTSVVGLAESYNRIALATQELGLSQDEILDVTRALQQTFRLSGSTIAEATAATIQLTQGLSSGQLRGQELRSVLEANAVFVNILSKELGIARGQLIKFAESGRITADVVLAGLRKNFQKLEEDASKLGTTIQQGLTAVFDSFVLTLNKVEKEVGVTSTLSKGLIFLAENMETVLAVVTVLAGSKGLVALINLVKDLNAALALGQVFAFIKALNPLTLAIAGVAAAGAAGVYALKQFAKANQGLSGNRYELEQERDAILKIIKEKEKQLAIEENILRSKALQGDTRYEQLAIPGIKKLRNELSGLNKKYDALSISILEYGKVTRTTSKKSIKDTGVTLKYLNDQLRKTNITYEQYTEATKNLKIQQLNKDFEDGKISLDNYYESLSKIPDALTPAQQGILSLNRAIEAQSETLSLATGIFQKTFQGIEDAMVEFATNGKFIWKDFVNAIIKEIIRLVIRATVIKPILQAIAGGIGGGLSVPATSNFSADAIIPGGNVAFSAKGNVFDKPGLSVFGEAGPEAILPLTRGSGGELGVKAVGGAGGNTIVNVFNNADAKVETKETTGPDGQKQIDLIISRKVKNMFAAGEMDRQMSTNYGVTRKGM